MLWGTPERLAASQERRRNKQRHHTNFYSNQPTSMITAAFRLTLPLPWRCTCLHLTRKPQLGELDPCRAVDGLDGPLRHPTNDNLPC